MAVVVGVHGIAQQFKGGYQLEGVWLASLRDGLVRGGHASWAETLGPTDMRVAFFGDLFRPEGAMAGAGPAFTPNDVKAGPELDLLTVLYEQAIAVEPGLAPPPGSM